MLVSCRGPNLRKGVHVCELQGAEFGKGKALASKYGPTPQLEINNPSWTMFAICFLHHRHPVVQVRLELVELLEAARCDRGSVHSSALLD